MNWFSAQHTTFLAKCPYAMGRAGEALHSNKAKEHAAGANAVLSSWGLLVLGDTPGFPSLVKALTRVHTRTHSVSFMTSVAC